MTAAVPATRAVTASFRATRGALIAAASGLLAGCISGADHFYVLDALPLQPRLPASASLAPVSLRLTIPSVVDRSQFVINTPTGVSIREHERWAAPLADQMSAVLSRDLERRRADLMVGKRPGSMDVVVDVVRVEAVKGGTVVMEAQWLLHAGAWTSAAHQEFTANAADTSYAAIAAALSSCVAQLADRLARELPNQT